MVFAEDLCFKWFQTAKIKPDSKDCILQCAVIPVDMSTFTCASRCEEFCKKSKCVADPVWAKKIKDGRPLNWTRKNEVTVKWTEVERQKILKILNRLPDELKNSSFEGFYRMKKSTDAINPATTDYSGKYIVIYDRAFENPFWTTESVITHELGHIIFLNMSYRDQQKYSAALGWNKALGFEEARPGPFISTRAKDDKNEDFAENFSFFLLDPSSLNSKVPIAYKWFSTQFSKDFKLKQDCEK